MQYMVVMSQMIAPSQNVPQ